MKRVCSIDLLRAIAVTLVVNSHFKGVYPTDILSFGGGFGLALFFLISGYLLYDIKEDTRFCKWYLPKILRLYIPLYAVRIIELLSGYVRIDSFKAFFMTFVFPGPWFTGAMVLLYALYFVLVKFWLKGKGGFRVSIVLGVCAAAYSVLFFMKPEIACFSIQSLQIVRRFSLETPYLITQFAWISCMIIGYWIAIKKFRFVSYLPTLTVLCFSVFAFFVAKYFTRHGENINLQFVLGPAYIAFATALFLLLTTIEPWVRKHRNNLCGKLVGVASMCSLEIYYVQFMWIEWLKDMVFPVNFAVLIIAITVSAYLIHAGSVWAIQRIISEKAGSCG